MQASDYQALRTAYASSWRRGMLLLPDSCASPVNQLAYFREQAFAGLGRLVLIPVMV